MKSVIEQKAELLDDFIQKGDFDYDIIDLIMKYNEITAPPTLQADPYIDEVLPARLVNYFKERLRTENGECPRLSMCATWVQPKGLIGIRGIGTKTIHEYAEILEKYGMLEKS